MITNYEPAQILELAQAGDFICGIKYVTDTFDWITGEWGQVYFAAMDLTDE